MKECIDIYDDGTYKFRRLDNAPDFLYVTHGFESNDHNLLFDFLDLDLKSIERKIWEHINQLFDSDEYYERNIDPNNTYCFDMNIESYEDIIIDELGKIHPYVRALNLFDREISKLLPMILRNKFYCGSNTGKHNLDLIFKNNKNFDIFLDIDQKNQYELLARKLMRSSEEIDTFTITEAFYYINYYYEGYEEEISFDMYYDMNYLSDIKKLEGVQKGLIKSLNNNELFYNLPILPTEFYCHITGNEKEFYECVEINSLSDILKIEVYKMIKSNTMVRRCKNCGRYFELKDKKTMYCSRIDNTGRKCSEVGSQRNFQNKK